VVVDIPKDVQFATGDYVGPEQARHAHGYKPQTMGDPMQIAEAAALIAQAKRPILYTGGGVINSGPEASRLLRELAHATGAPVTSTLMGLGAFPAADPQWLGMLGMHGTFEANNAMHDCDVMVCLGARFDDRVTGRLDAFSPDSRKIHVDIDRSALNKNVLVDIGIVGDVGKVMAAMLEAARHQGAVEPVEMSRRQLVRGAPLVRWRLRLTRVIGGLSAASLIISQVNPPRWSTVPIGLVAVVTVIASLCLPLFILIEFLNSAGIELHRQYVQKLPGRVVSFRAFEFQPSVSRLKDFALLVALSVSGIVVGYAAAYSALYTFDPGAFSIQNGNAPSPVEFVK